VDTAAQKTIVSIIRRAFPDHRILAEEEGANAFGDPSSPYRWVIDPLDGTVPYMHGKPEFACIVALQENNRTIVGAIVLPEKGERFWGARGVGAFFNGKRVRHLRKTKNMHDAILCANFQRESHALTLRGPRCASIQNCGCAAMELMDILKGQNDGVFFEGPRLWDVAAGCLLIEEAGGRSRTELTDPRNPRGAIRCVASTPEIFEELCAFVFRKARG
jgi:myo-inositol-1(or 4)-monophosphatase